MRRLLAAAAVAAVVVAILLVRRAAPAEATRAPRGADSASAGVEGTDGRVLEYDVRVAQTVTLRLSEAFVARVAEQGGRVAAPAPPTPATVESSGRMRIELAGPRALWRMGRVRAGLPDAMVATDLSGDIRELLVGDGVPEARAFVAGLVLSMRFVFPPSPAATWTRMEEDLSGRYEARYTMEGRRVTRERGPYANAEVTGRGRAVAEVEDVLVSVEVDERIRRRGAEFAEDVEVATQLQAMLVGTGRGQVSFDGFRGRPVSPSEAGAAGERARLERLAGGVTLAEAAADVKRMWPRLVALLKLSDAACAEAGRLARDRSVPEATRLALVNALGSAGTPGAQRALIDVLPELAEGVAVALGMARAPLPETERALRALAEGEAGSRAALLGLGAIGGRVTGKRAEAIDLFLRESRARETDPVLWLQAVGNAGRDCDAVIAMTRHPDRDVRAAAAYALRFVQDGRADAALGEALADGESRVRRSAAEALAFRRTAAATDLLVRALGDRGSEEVRLAAVAALRPRPEARAALEEAARGDPSERVRKAAGRK